MGRHWVKHLFSVVIDDLSEAARSSTLTCHLRTKESSITYGNRCLIDSLATASPVYCLTYRHTGTENTNHRETTFEISLCLCTLRKMGLSRFLVSFPSFFLYFPFPACLPPSFLPSFSPSLLFSPLLPLASFSLYLFLVFHKDIPLIYL